MSVAYRPDVLIVEDDRVLLYLLVHSLHEVDLTTDVAGDVVEAKRLLARHAYAVLVLDLVLPDGSGVDVLEFIKAEKLAPMNIVVITAAEAFLLARIDRSLVKTIMFKPLDVAHFVASVRALIRDEHGQVPQRAR